METAVELCRDIMGQYGITVDRVLRHYDVTGKQCPRPWVVDQKAWEAFRGRLVGDGTPSLSAQGADRAPGGGAKPARDEGGKTAWYAGDRAWAMEAGISDGTRPEDVCTRAEVWAMLRRLDQRK